MPLRSLLSLPAGNYCVTLPYQEKDLIQERGDSKKLLAMQRHCFVKLLSSRFNIFAVYVLFAICIIMTISQVNLLSSFPVYAKRRSLEVRFEIISEYTSEDNPTQSRQPNDYEDITMSNDNHTTGQVEITDSITESGTILTAKERDFILSEENMKGNSQSIYPKNECIILIWTNEEYFEPPKVPRLPLCGGGCLTTTDRSFLTTSDAVVFTMKGMNLNDLPDPNLRKKDQVFVWWSEESPWTSLNFYEKKLEEIDADFFNWTMTYRRDSDVNAMMIPFTARDYFVRKIINFKKTHPSIQKPAPPSLPFTGPEKPAQKSEIEIKTLKLQAQALVESKSKMAVWVASNCGYTAGAALRMKHATNLFNLGLSIDAYGRCGNETVPEYLTDFAQFLREYKFYLSFENTLHCRDYLTEKFWYNALFSGLVPVIWGPRKSDVEEMAPPHSFIHSEDFASHEDLVKYLIHLSENNDLYMEYFAWWWEMDGYYPVFGITETGEGMEGAPAMFHFEVNAMCHLCSLLNSGIQKRYHKSITSIHDWWYHDESETCLDEKHLTDLQWPPDYGTSAS